jgi:hypothetical protein
MTNYGQVSDEGKGLLPKGVAEFGSVVVGVGLNGSSLITQNDFRLGHFYCVVIFVSFKHFHSFIVLCALIIMVDCTGLITMPVDDEDICFWVDGNAIEGEAFCNCFNFRVSIFFLHEYLHIHLHATGDEYFFALAGHCHMDVQKLFKLLHEFLFPIVFHPHEVEPTPFLL